MTDFSTLILAGFFFLMGAAVIGVVWYLQSVANGNFRKGKHSAKPDPNLAEVARLMRDKTTQDLVVTINGNAYRNANELNPGQLRRVHFASKVFSKWLADTPPPAPTETSTHETTLAEASSDNSSAVPAPPDITPAITSATELAKPDIEWIPAESAPEISKPEFPPAFMADVLPDVKPVSTQLSDVVGGILKPSSTPSPTPEFKSIAMQIDEILQEMIAGTPFENRGIKVNDAPDRGVMVTLDGNTYPGVKDVPDEEVRNLIRSAVVEWERAGKFSAR